MKNVSASRRNQHASRVRSPDRAERSPFLGDEPAFARLRCGRLPADSLRCGNDLVEARVTAQIIPARIEAQITVGWAVRDRCDTFKLLQCAVALAGPRVNQREIGDAPIAPLSLTLWRSAGVQRPALASGIAFSFSAKPSIKSPNFQEIP